MKLRPSLILVAAFLVPFTAKGEARVWVVDESVRIDPVTVTVIERRPRGNWAGSSSRYLASNPVFQEQNGSVHLQGARNETVAFQVIVADSDGEIRELDLEFQGLDGAMSLRRGVQVSLFRQWYVEIESPSTHERAQEVTNTLEAWFPVERYAQRLVTSLGRGWYPDPLIPLDGPAAGTLPGLPMSLPDGINRVPNQRAQGFWVDIWIPRDAPAGSYRGDVVVTTDGERHLLPVELEVLPLELSDEFHAGLGSVSYGFVGEHLIELGPEAVHELYRLVHRHRLTLDALYLHPEREEHGRLDWRSYDALAGPLLDGRAFSDLAGYVGPGRGQPVRRFVLPLDWSWPVRPGGEDYDDIFRETLRQVELHIISRDWTRTEWSLFINLTDEPHTTEAFELIHDYGELLRTARLQHPELFHHRIDAGPFKSIEDELPGWDLSRIFNEIGDQVDIWNCCASVANCPADALGERLREHEDEQAWFYFSNAAGEPAVGSLLIDAEALGPRTWGWITWRYGFSAGVSWELGWPTPDCLRDSDCSGFGLHGDASLVYLADAFGSPGMVLPSIRLKNLRRGAEDHEYLWLLAESGHRELADAFAYRLVPRGIDDGLVTNMPGAWEHDPRVWDQVRREMGSILAGRADAPDLAVLRADAPNPANPPIGLTRRASLLAAGLLVILLVLFVLLTEKRQRSGAGS